MFNTLIIKWIAAALVAAAISASIYAGYSHIKSSGYQEAVEFYDKRDKEAQALLSNHIHTLEVLSKSVVDNNAEYLGKIDKDIHSILTTVNGKPPYVVVNGKCLPSQEFTDAFNKIVGKANE